MFATRFFGARGGTAAFSAALVMAGTLLVGLRVLAFHSMRSDLALDQPLSELVREPIVLVGVIQHFVLSLCFELAVLVALCWLVRKGRVGRWASRAALAVLLWINIAGTMVFLVLRTYAKGFHLTGLSFREMGSVVVTFLTPPVALGLLAPIGIAWLFGRAPGKTVGERGSTRFLLPAMGLAAFAGAFQLIRNPTRYPSIAHSPATVLFIRALPRSEVAASLGKPVFEDWLPARNLATPWKALGDVERKFNIVVVVLESVRSDVFWPAPRAPPMPNLAALAPHSAVFTRAYAHEPLSIKGLEALLFGIYPAPSWESPLAGENDLALDSVPERWRGLGMRAAFIGYGEIPFVGDRDFLTRRGFTQVVERKELERIDAQYSDRTLVQALDRFIEDRPGEPFGAFLWPHHTHMPYQMPAPIANPHPSNSFEAYLDAIAFTDLMIGDLISLLRRRNLFENTVVVLVGDHGEAFNEHPESGLGHGDWLFEVTAHVPLVLINPRLFHGEGDDRIVQQKDVAATVTWLAGDRRTYLNVGSPIFFRKTSEAAYLTSHFDVSSLRGALVRGRLKYIFRAAAEGLPGDDRLFDLVADPGETANLWRARAEEGREMKAQYFGWLTYWNERWMAVELRAKPVSRAWLDATLFTSEASPRAKNP